MSLLGSTISTTIGGDTVSVLLNEVEAYGGADDPASHAFRTRTRRNEPMFAAAGTVYVYRSYGIHWCMNVVTGRKDEPQAVLLRGGVVVAGRDAAMVRRGRSVHLADGPGKLAQALDITGDLSGTHLNNNAITISHLGTVQGYEATPRVGITKATKREWRFLSRDTG